MAILEFKKRWGYCGTKEKAGGNINVDFTLWFSLFWRSSCYHLPYQTQHAV